jgi:hypothetical protein
MNLNPTIVVPGMFDVDRFTAEMNIGTQANPVMRSFSIRLITCTLDGNVPTTIHPLQSKLAFDKLINMINQGSNLPGLDVVGAVWKTGEARHLSCLKGIFAEDLTALKDIPIVAGNPISGEGYYYMPNLQKGVVSVGLASDILRSYFFFLAVRQEDEVAP